MKVAAPLLTRGELLDRLREKGFDADDQDLAYWQRTGAIPYPTKRRKDKTTIAVYPIWMVELIELLRQGQQFGLNLKEIAPVLKPDVARFTASPLNRK